MSVIDSTPVLTEKTNGTTTQSDEVEDVEEIVDLDPDEVASDNEDVLEGKEPGMNRRLNVALMLCHRFPSLSYLCLFPCRRVFHYVFLS